MPIINNKLAVLGCLCFLAFCVVLKAQTSAPDQSSAPVPAAPSTSANPTTVDASNTQFPHEAKTPPSNVIPSVAETPTTFDGYDTHFAVEFGGRTLSQSGNADVYGTFVNLKPGIRLMDESLEMHSVNHEGFLFDDLSLGSFGLGGDPNEVARLRVSKHHWYDLSSSWRRDINFWDYNLLANPLNPTSGSFVIQNNVSPALLDLSRKMLDLDLTLFPDSSLQFILGYSHYNNSGPSLTTVHESTDALLFQRWRDISDTYRFGVSYRPLERTRVSFNEIYTHNKSDTSDQLNSFPNSLSNGASVNLGLISGNNSPCVSPFTGSFVTPTCSLFTGYSYTAPYYTDIPTEQAGFQSSYFRRLHINGRASYTGAETHIPNSLEQYNGFGSNRLQSITSGNGFAKQITTSADGGVTYEITERFSIDDQFRWYDYRIPSAVSLVQNYLFGINALASPNTFSTATCPPPYTASTCPYHTTGSSADQTDSSYSLYQAQSHKRNTFELHYDFAHNVTGYIGYRFERQDIVIDGDTATVSSYFPLLPNRGACAGLPLVSGVCQVVSAPSVSIGGVEINTHAGVMGLAAQPVHGLRLNADMEVDYADNVFDNIMPRHMQLYRGKAIYTRKWVDLNANVRIQEQRDMAYGLGDLQHNRSFSFGVVLPISTRLGLDFNYSYNNFLSNLNICFSETPTPAFATTTTLCPAGYLTTVSYYRDIDHFGSANVMFKPISRTTITAGYTITSTNGDSLLLNPLAPLGPVAINYHLPTAAIAIQLHSRLTLKGGWNLYDYIEKSPPGPVASRNFEANVISISLRYAM